MKNTTRNLAVMGGALALAFLAGCGGGGDGAADTTAAPAGATNTAADTTPTTPPAPVTATATASAAKYVGTWGGCFARTATTSRRETLVITQLTADSVTFSFSEVSFAQPSCAGSAGTTETDSGTIAFSGTKTIGTETVDKGTVTSAGSPAEKQVFLVRAGTPPTLSFGKNAADGGPLDAEGYPATLEPNGLSKQ